MDWRNTTGDDLPLIHRKPGLTMPKRLTMTFATSYIKDCQHEKNVYTSDYAILKILEQLNHEEMKQADNKDDHESAVKLQLHEAAF